MRKSNMTLLQEMRSFFAQWFEVEEEEGEGDISMVS